MFGEMPVLRLLVQTSGTKVDGTLQFDVWVVKDASPTSKSTEPSQKMAVELAIKKSGMLSY